MEMEKSKVLIQFLLIFRQSGGVLFFLYARRLRRYTAKVLFSKRKKLGFFFMLVVEDACFRMRITLGVVLIRFLACTESVPEGFRSGSGVALNYRVHEKVIKTC